MTIVAITGGIGAGKSVVSRILRAVGIEVYDCDAEAKRLMDCSPDIKRRLSDEIHSSTVRPDGSIDRGALASIVFADTEKLSLLNSIVHSSVRDDIARRAAASSGSLFFIETAILYQSGLDRMADRVWEVTAPENVRIERVMKRNGCSAEEVKRRISSQQFQPEKLHRSVAEIVNDDLSPVLPQVLTLLETLA